MNNFSLKLKSRNSWQLKLETTSRIYVNHIEQKIKKNSVLPIFNIYEYFIGIKK